jgi:sugar lactone lactonase YvrE
LPVIDWATPLDIGYGTPLGVAQLDAVANVPGTFTYSPALGTLLSAGDNQLLSVTFTPDDTVNYSSATDTVNINVTPAPLTVSGITANDKVYDSTIKATLNNTTAALVGVLSGDAVTLSTRGATGTFASKDVGNNLVTVSGLTISGAQAADYALIQPTTTANITPAPLTVSGVTANTKVYDATTTATLNMAKATLTGVFSGDAVTLSNAPSTTLTGLNNPAALAIDTNGNVYVAGYYGNTVLQFAAGSTTPTAVLTGLNTPSDVVVDANGNVYVANAGSDTVSIFTPGSTIASLTLSGLNDPNALAVDSSGNLYVANLGNNTVSKFAPNSTTPSLTLTGLSFPTALAVDGSGNLYVACQGGTVSKFAPGSTAPSLTITGLTSPLALVADAAGNLFVANTFANTVLRFAPGKTAPNATLTGLNYPTALAVDSAGNLYAANYNANTVSVFAPGGTTPTATLTGLSYPTALQFDAGGNLYVANSGGTGVSVFASSVLTSTVTPVATFASKDVGKNIAVAVSGLELRGAQAADYALTQPTTTGTITPAVLSVTGISARDKVYDGTLAATVNTGALALSGLYQGDDVALVTTPGATSGTFDTAAVGNHTVTVSGLTIKGAQASDYTVQVTLTANITPAPLTVTGITANNKAYDGTTAATVNTAGAVLSGILNGDAVALAVGPSATLSGLNGTVALAVDAGGNLYAANESGNTVTKFAPGATTASVTLNVSDPVALAVDASGNLYVASFTGNTVSKFAPGSTAPSAIYAVNDPVGLTVDNSGNLYVASFKENTVTRFTPGSTAAAAVLTGLTGPYRLALDAGGNLYVANFTSGTVSKFAPGATTPSATLTGLSGPVALALDSSGSLYVANMNSNTVSKFAPGATTPTSTLTVFRESNQYISSPIALAVDGSNNLYVATSMTAASGVDTLTVSEFTPGSTTPRAVLAGVKDPYALAVDATGNLFVANVGANTISEFTKATLNSLGATGTFASSGPGANIPVAISGLTLAGPQALNYALVQPTTTASITSVSPATHFRVTVPAASILGAPISFTVAALDQNNNFTAAYTGSIHFASTDTSASLPSDTTLTSGTGTFTATFNASGAQTISVKDTHNLGITGTSNFSVVSSGAARFAVSAPASATAGSPFLVTVTAQDASGQRATHYSGIAQLSSSDSRAVLPASVTLSNGMGAFLVTMKASGAFTIKAQDAVNSSINGTTASIVITPAAVSFFTVVAPSFAVTGNAITATVTARDAFGNTATGYGGSVHFTSSDASAALPADSTLTGGMGTFSVTLKTAGSQTITAADTKAVTPTIIGTSNAIATSGLVVTSFTPNAAGFTVTFDKPIVPQDIALYGASVTTVTDVTLVGKTSGPITGSLLVDPGNTSITFKASAASLAAFFSSTILPDDTYTATLVSGSGSSGFLDSLGAGLDGTNSAGHANYTTTFTVANAGKEALSIPDFARGPDGTHSILLPNDSGSGIPVTLSNAAGVKDVAFTLTYNPVLFKPTGAGTGDSSAAKSVFSMGSITSIDDTHASVRFTYHNDVAQNGTVILGDILAVVPNGAANSYKAKELLSFSAVTVNNAPFTGVWANGVHVNAYFGDVSGNGTIDGLDVVTASAVAAGNATGFAAYPSLDPAIIGDIANDGTVDTGAVSDLADFTAHVAVPQIPTIPTGLTITPTGPDPTLSLGAAQRQGDEEKGRQGETSASPGLPVSLSPGLAFTVPVLLDDPHPAGSSGMTEAILALTYDPAVLSVSTADITLGSIPGMGTGWQLTAVVDQATGQIGIELYSTVPITAAVAGSLVNIRFHVLPGASAPSTAVKLVNSLTIEGQQFTTQADDAQGQFVLSPGVDNQVVRTSETIKRRGVSSLRAALVGYLQHFGVLAVGASDH